MTTATKGRSTAAKISSREEEAIRKQIDEFVAAWNRHNPQAMSMVFAEDADLINPFGRIAKSRTEIEKLFKEEHAGTLKNSHMALKFKGLRFLAQDAAVSDHTFEVTEAQDRADKGMSIRGHLSLAFKKHGDTWLVEVCRPMIPAPSPEAK
jgi:uncharacterized protein (TIGR02246 family)